MKVTDFIHEMQTTSAILGRDTGVSVTFEGDEAYTDGKRINLPSMDLTADLTNEQVRLMRGYVDHEAGHHRHSDLPRVMDFYSRCVNNGKEDLKNLHNFVEDVWMEDQVIYDYPGAYKNLLQANHDINSKGCETLRTDQGKQMVEGNHPMAIGGAIKAINDTYYRDGGPAEEFLSHYSDKQKGWVERWMKDAKACESTEDCITLAKSIYKFLQENSDNMDELNPEDFDPKEGEGMDEGEPLPDNGEGKIKGEGEGRGEATLMPEYSDMVSSEAHDGKGGIGGMDGPLKGGYRVLSTKSDITYKRGSTDNRGSSQVNELVNETNASEYDRCKTEISGEIRVMKNKLKRALLAKQQRDWDCGRLTGRLDTKRLVAASNRVDTVFKQRIDRAEEDTAITILVDLSGSMHGVKEQVARDCVIALSECLEGSTMPFKIVGFCNKGYPGADNSHGQWHRYERLDTVIFKDFGDPLRKCRASVGLLPDAVGGNNSDYDFISQELATLKKRKEGRKVLFVLSDGEPACASDADQNEHIKHCKNAIKEAERNGVECVGIGICSSAVTRIYSNNVVVQNVNELSSKSFRKLSELLVK